MIRVAYFINSLEQGGAERQLSELIAGLDRARFAPSLVVCTRRGELAPPPVEALRSLDDALFPTPWGAARLASVLRDLRPDILHTSKGLENVVGRAVARAVGVPRVVGSVRCPTLTPREALGERATWRMADAHIVNSVGIRRELLALGVAPDAVEVVENGVDLARFSPLDDDARRAVRAEFGFGEGPLLVHVGRLSPEKNQLAVVDALARLRLPPGARVAFAGRDSLLVYGRAVKARARLLGVAGRCAFLGAVKGVERLVAAADVTLLPSHYEGLPNAVIESLACGVPAVVTPEANADAVVTDGEDGFVARSTHADDVALAIARALSLPPDRRRAMGALGRTRAVERFALARMVRRTEAVYDRVLQGR